ncbi:MAG: hypothetical protein AAB783_00335 [Patescibacteria group bacterium]
MKNNLYIKEVVTSVILMVFAALLANPMHMWMPDSIGTMAAFGMFVIFCALASFIWHERVRDEREAAHRMYASRAAYLAGAGVLVLGIITQGLHHNVDLWLVYALGSMILAKLFTIYSLGQTE